MYCIFVLSNRKITGGGNKSEETIYFEWNVQSLTFHAWILFQESLSRFIEFTLIPIHLRRLDYREYSGAENQKHCVTAAQYEKTAFSTFIVRML